MSILARHARFLADSISNGIFGNAADVIDERQESSSQTSYEPGKYEPTVVDVIEVKQVLLKLTGLPLELIETVIDLSEYWPHTSTVLEEQKTIRAGNPAEENAFLLRSYPLGYLPQGRDGIDQKNLNTKYPKMKPWKIVDPKNELPDWLQDSTSTLSDQWKEMSMARGEFPCRKVVFTLKSNDQGWGGNHSDRGSYKGSFTWFDVGKEELVAFEEPPEVKLGDSRGNDIVRHIRAAQLAHFDFNLSNEELSSPKTIKPKQLLCIPSTLAPNLNRTRKQYDSHDSSDGTEHESTPEGPTYGDEFEHGLLPNLNCLQRNRTARGDATEHKIIWSCDDNVDPDSMEGKALDDEGRGRATATGEYVRKMKIGDTVTVWAKARFPNWHNVVRDVKIDVYWAV